jgi:hypothetical protein
MIGDISRTGTYRKAILGNSNIAFNNKNVLDLGAGMSACGVGLMPGSGILSFISAQAGAKQVIALEASSMADKMALVRLISLIVYRRADEAACEGGKHKSKESAYEEQDTDRQGDGGG